MMIVAASIARPIQRHAVAAVFKVRVESVVLLMILSMGCGGIDGLAGGQLRRTAREMFVAARAVKTMSIATRMRTINARVMS